MYIGKAAQLAGTTIKCIRHYEDIGLLPSPQRLGNYRVYTQDSVELLKFIKCAQQLGFKLKEMLAIVESHRGQPLPWEVVSHAIEVKKSAVANQIKTLQKVHAGLVEFEAQYKSACEPVAAGS
ncbi:MerR family transcriptional regulator [Pseudomonas endophytica]|uniref:MerR family transcriptional regulator n=1 Tax=Pseudomonas endophytica TaxID=1563157 RepID=A0A0Q0YV73_9PSED|nr:MerR family transcriptional regulator [Pseudomonas endophytica]KQB53119.1 MerR family transcriptional regulator [Pseudomonas endophytica]